MPSHIRSAALRGIDALPVDIEVEVLGGLPGFTVVGLTDKAIQESRERMTAALTNLGYNPPRRKTIVSFAPASLKKEGSLYDLPIALGFLIASKQLEGVNFDRVKNAWFVGELGLDGTIRPVRGILPIVLAGSRLGIKAIYIPHANAAEAAPLADKISIYPARSLQELINHIQSSPSDEGELEGVIPKLKPSQNTFKPPKPDIDMSDIKGQDHAKRALAICAAGGHNALLIGPPGTGKTLLARALIGILPRLSRDESFTVTSLYSIAGLLPEDVGLIEARPFRSPHHGASPVALVGGGTHPKPGEVSLAHHGVLFLDELPEFSRSVLEQLRQPIEDGFVSIARAGGTMRFPARSMLIAAMNPCPCGFVGSTRKDCTCAPGDILRYQRRVSGPLLDRFDLHILVSDIGTDELLDQKPSGPTSSQYQALIEHARERQWTRQQKTNAELGPKQVGEYAAIDQLAKSLITGAQEKFHLSSRGIHRLLKVARTIADLKDKPNITADHLAEALQYREQLKSVLPDFV